MSERCNSVVDERYIHVCDWSLADEQEKLGPLPLPAAEDKRPNSKNHRNTHTTGSLLLSVFAMYKQY